MFSSAAMFVRRSELRYTKMIPLAFQRDDLLTFACCKIIPEPPDINIRVTAYKIGVISHTICIIRANQESCFYDCIFPNQRGTVTLRGFDLLDKNKSVLRTSQLNYPTEQAAQYYRQVYDVVFCLQAQQGW